MTDHDDNDLMRAMQVLGWTAMVVVYVALAAGLLWLSCRFDWRF